MDLQISQSDPDRLCPEEIISPTPTDLAFAEAGSACDRSPPPSGARFVLTRKRSPSGDSLQGDAAHSLPLEGLRSLEHPPSLPQKSARERRRDAKRFLTLCVVRSMGKNVQNSLSMKRILGRRGVSVNRRSGLDLVNRGRSNAFGPGLRRSGEVPHICLALVCDERGRAVCRFGWMDVCVGELCTLSGRIVLTPKTSLV